MMYGGVDINDLRPIEAEEEMAALGVRGTHRGNAVGLNVRNPQPSTIYSWIRHPRHDRAGAQLQEFLNWGYEVCGPDSPEMQGTSNYLNISQLGLDNYKVHGDVVLVKISEERYRVRQEYREAQARAALDGASEAFISKGHEIEDRYSFARSAEGPLYYRGPSHFVGNPDKRRFAEEESS